MRVYTRTGDQGTTSLASGTRVPKYHERLEAYGTVDELNSFVAWVEALVIDPVIKDNLTKVQNRLFTISSNLAMDKDEFRAALPKITETDITELERDMDRMLDQLPDLKNFILPGGNQTVAACHIARTVCRRAERLMVKLSELIPIEETHMKFVNRLSDYLFVAARKSAADSGLKDKIWYPDYQKRE